MKKNTTTICLAFLSLGVLAQSPTSSVDDLPIKNVFSNLRYIPSKSFTTPSYSGHDSASIYKEKIVTTNSFYINRFEVTNKEYRDFVVFVRDSLAHTLLKDLKKGSNRINWNDPRLEPMMLSPDERIFGRNEIDPGKIGYELDFSDQKEIISIYPDTLVWLNDFSYSYNEPLVKNYFSSKLYDNYPVVGLNIKQAMAFCQWKTTQLNKLLNQAGSKYEVIVRLPGNNEWEAAATNGTNKDKNDLWGKCCNSNFGIITGKNGFMVKDYDDDGYFYTNPVNHYPAGAYGLYNMKGNIAEWTSDPDNVTISKENEKSFIVKGGGWDSDPFYLQTGACQFFPASAAHSFLGFRYVVYIKKK